MNKKHFIGVGCSFSDGGYSWISKLPSRLGIEKVHNIARGSCGNQFIRTNLIYKVSQLMGHSVVQVTEIYSHLIPKDFKGVLSMVDT